MTDELPVRRFFARDGLELAYRELGRGRPLILLHGFAATSSVWLRSGVAAHIAGQGHRVILPDLRGHGDSARPHSAASYPPDVLPDDGFALIEALRLDDYDLGGYSLGGRIVLRMLARGARAAHAIIGGQALDATAAATDRTGQYRAALAALARGDLPDPASPGGWMANGLRRSGGDPEALALVLDTFVATPAVELARIETPTLVVVGREDASHAGADALAAALPSARFSRVPGNHLNAPSSPEFAAEIARFIAEH